MGADMRIIEQQRFGGPEVLELVERDLPPPGPGEVQLRVAAAGVNPVDAYVSRGDIPILGDPPFTLGWDVAGTVMRLGPGVAGFNPGDRVMGLLNFPKPANGYAEAVNARAGDLVPVPNAMTDAQAGALPLAGLTAWQALVEHGQVRAGEKVLITAAGGGVGHLAVQIAKARGAEVWASARAVKHDALRRLGADHVQDTRHQPAAEAGPFDLVLHGLAEVSPMTSVAAIRPGGRVITLPPLATVVLKLKG